MFFLDEENGLLSGLDSDIQDFWHEAKNNTFHDLFFKIIDKKKSSLSLKD